MIFSTFRGYKIYEKDGEWFFSDTNNSVSITWKERLCGCCNIDNTPEGYDGCIGRLPGVMNACCGHGESKLAYIQFTGGLTIRGLMALWLGLSMRRLIKIANLTTT